MMVHIKPNTIDGRPSTISVELMFTSLICVIKKKIIIISDILECHNRAEQFQTAVKCLVLLHSNLIHRGLSADNLSIWSQTYVYTKLTIYSMSIIPTTTGCYDLTTSFPCAEQINEATP